MKKNHILSLMLCVSFLGTVTTVGAAPPSTVEVVSIAIDPETPEIGQYPTISGRVKGSKAVEPQERTVVNVIAVLVLPNNSVKSWTWKNVSFGRDETREFAIPKEYNIRFAGKYKVEYYIYDADVRHRLTMKSREFSAVPRAQTVEKPPTRLALERNTFGIGLYGNVLNASGGGTILIWPFEHVGFQVSYTFGRFTTTEARLLVKFYRVAGFNPYMGVGYLSVSKDSDVIGVTTTFKDSGVSGIAGVEVPLGRKIYGYAEVSGASIDLQKIVTNGGQTVKATVDYAPITIGVGIVYYLF